MSVTTSFKKVSLSPESMTTIRVALQQLKDKAVRNVGEATSDDDRTFWTGWRDAAVKALAELDKAE